MVAITATAHEFGRLPSGEAVAAIELVNAGVMSVRLISYGAAIQSVRVPDRHGRLDEVTYGHGTLRAYLDHPQFAGATVGRVANRIAGARFELDGKLYRLQPNDGPNTLHGGCRGFDKINWRVAHLGEDSVTFACTSPDGDEGFPGTLEVSATYQLHSDNRLSVTYLAATDAPTLVNLSNHAYWNLAGPGSGRSALDHWLSIAAQSYLPVDTGLIPTGELRSVAGTAFDFRGPRRIGERVRRAGEAQLRPGRGYDHNWVIDGAEPGRVWPNACLLDPVSGRRMKIESDQPGLQFYSGNFFDGTVAGHGDAIARMGDFVALEPQGFPDAANKPQFPPIRLEPGEAYRSLIGWTFDICEETSP